MASCYILYSKKLDQFYVGITTTDVSIRTVKHNSGSYGNHRFTAKTDDWEVFLAIECSDNSQSVMIEKHIKKMKSRTYIENLKKYPEMVEELLSTSNCNKLSR